MKIRVTINFIGRQSGALGVCYEMNARRTIEVPDQFTMEDAMESARQALYYPDESDTHPYGFERVSVKQVMFN